MFIRNRNTLYIVLVSFRYLQVSLINILHFAHFALQPLYHSSSNPWETAAASANNSATADSGWNHSSELFPSSIWSSSSDNSNLLDSNQESQVKPETEHFKKLFLNVLPLKALPPQKFLICCWQKQWVVTGNLPLHVYYGQTERTSNRCCKINLHVQQSLMTSMTKLKEQAIDALKSIYMYNKVS